MSKPEDKTILVVDDEEDVREYLATVLEDAGFRVVTANDGNQALERLQQGRPDFISLDLVMPGKSGMRFLREMRRNRDWADIPFVVVTAHAHDELGRDDLKDILAERAVSGPSLVLEKPVKPGQYVRLICERLGVTHQGTAGDARAEELRREILDRIRSADATSLEAALRALKGKP
jgi:CheY-like chemotaxis protein